MFDNDSKMNKVLRVTTQVCYVAGLLGIATAVRMTFSGGALALQGWVFGGMIGMILLATGYGLSRLLAPSQADDFVRDELPSALGEQRQRHARNGLLCFGGAAIAFPIGVLLLIHVRPNVLGLGGLVASFVGLTCALGFAWERVRLKRRYQRLQCEALVSWTRDGQDVFVGRDAAYYDGVLIEWDGYANILADVVWSDGTMEFRVDRYAPKGGHVATITLQIPVPKAHEEQAQEALQAIRTAPLGVSTILLLTLQIIMGVVGFTMLGLMVTKGLGFIR